MDVGRHDERRPGSQAEVGVNDVKALLAIFAPQLSSGGGVATRREGEALEFKLWIFELAERFQLVADEAAELGSLGRGPHVGDD